MLHAQAIDDGEAGEAPAPQVFVRAFSIPPGAPWEQARAANLEARHGAPLPIAELMLRVRRLEPWRPGAPGRYGAFYIRSREYRGPFEAEVELDGRPLRVAFGIDGTQALRLRRAGVIGGLAAAAVGLLVIGVGLATATRQDAEARLEFLEQQSAQRLRMARAFDRKKERLADLERATAGAVRMDEVIDDLAWVATSKAQDAQILAVHWDRGVLAVEARGQAAPFSAPDRRIERYEKPLRSGVWLWAVGPRGSGEIQVGEQAP